MVTFDRRKFIKKFITHRLELTRKKRADKRHQREIAKQLAKQQAPKKMSGWLWVIIWLLPFGLVLGLIVLNYSTPQLSTQNMTQSVSSESLSQTSAPLITKVDDVVETGLVADVAKTANLSVALTAANSATSAEIQTESSQKTSTVINKPDLASIEGVRQKVQTHVVKEGETVQSIAGDYGISAQTLRWANNMSNDDLSVGKELKILPVDGIHYKVKSGDTYDAIVKKYGSTESQIVAINDLELSGLRVDSMIVIPGGNLPETERPGYVAPRVYTATTYTQSQGSHYRPANGAGVRYYPWGWCTWYAAYTFPLMNGGKQIGNWGNANTWDDSARGTPGFTVSRTPTAGAIFQADGPPLSYDWRGHVGIVDSVSYNPDGSISAVHVSDMNGIAGYGRVGRTTWTPQKAAQYTYIK